MILTLFPDMFSGFLEESIIGRAQKKGILEIGFKNIRDFGLGERKTVDDTPYGGGAGMVLRVDVLKRAIDETKKELGDDSRVILMTPQGRRFNQGMAEEYASAGGKLIIVCGHYEGFDERVRDFADDEISIGDYVLTGGEIAAAVFTDAVARLLEGVLGKKASHQDESFSVRSVDSKNYKLLEYPHYTRPEEFEGRRVPEVLLSGNHARIASWRNEMSAKRTEKRRPDLKKAGS